MAPNLLEELPDGVLFLSADGHIDRANAAFSRTLGFRGDELVGRPLDRLVAEEDMLHLLGFEAVFGDEPVQELNVMFLGADGGMRPLICNSCKAQGWHGTVITTRSSGNVQRELADTTRWAAVEQERAGELAKARDDLAVKNDALGAAQQELEKAYATLKDEVAARQRLENELRLSSKLEAIGQLAAGIAHEINTPVQYVGDSIHFVRDAVTDLMGVIEKLQTVNRSVLEGSPSLEAATEAQAAEESADLEYLSENVPKGLERALDGLNRVAVIVRSLKAFAHPDQKEMTSVDLNEALRNALTIARNEYVLVADAETDFTELPRVRCYAGEINQVILNIVVNASHAIADVAKVSGKKGRITVRTRCDGDYVCLSIGDTGGGIPEHVRDRIFDPFFTTKEVGRGTGQGLAIARSVVVDKHRGELSFETEIGSGTVFLIRLPIAGSQAAALSRR